MVLPFTEMERLRIIAKNVFGFVQVIPVLPVKYPVGDNNNVINIHSLRSRESSC